MAEIIARAPSNIALAKYWGKLERAGNYPAVPSLSMTLNGLYTETRVEFSADFQFDEVLLDGRVADESTRRRVSALLDKLRTLAGLETRARVVSANNFPTAAGLASSASGFAALTLAASRAAGLDLTPAEMSSLARECSASAARSLFGGYVALEVGAHAAQPLLDAEAYPLSMLICLLSSKPKVMGSTGGMQHTRDTSPYYSAWLEHAPRLYDEVRAGVLARDLERIGPATTQSALMMHASMWAARPALSYWVPASVAVLECCAGLRGRGVLAFPTMDAGPNVKVLCSPDSAAAIGDELEALPGVERVISCNTGKGPVTLEVASLALSGKEKS